MRSWIGLGALLLGACCLLPTAAAQPGADAAPETDVVVSLRRERELTEQVNSIFSLALAPDGKRMAAVGAAPKVVVYDTESWTAVASSETPRGRLLAVAFSPDGAWLAACGDPRECLLFDASDLSLRQRIAVDYRPTRLCLAGQPADLITGGPQSSPQVWRLEPSGELRGALNAQNYRSLYGCAATADGSQLYVAVGAEEDPANKSYALLRWDLEQKQATLLAELPTAPRQLTLLEREGLVCLALENAASVYNMQSGEAVAQWSLPGVKVNRLRATHEAGCYAACTNEGRLLFLRTGRPQPIADQSIGNQIIYDCLVVGDQLVTCTQQAGKSIVVWRFAVRGALVFPVGREQLPAEARQVTTWTDASDLFRMQASLMEVTETHVTLQPADGGEPLTLPQAQLHATDRDRLRNWLDRASPAAPAPPPGEAAGSSGADPAGSNSGSAGESSGERAEHVRERAASLVARPAARRWNREFARLALTPFSEESP